MSSAPSWSPVLVTLHPGEAPTAPRPGSEAVFNPAGLSVLGCRPQPRTCLCTMGNECGVHPSFLPGAIVGLHLQQQDRGFADGVNACSI
jgi:hypothetical protein